MRFVLLLAGLCASPLATAQTTLSAGDIAFTGYQCDAPDTASFVLLTDLDAGTVISFTDKGWLVAGGFRGYEGNADTTLLARTEITLDFASTTATHGTLAGSMPNLSGDGDQVFAFQGDIGTPSLIAGIHMNGDWDTTDGSNNSTQPPALVGASFAIAPEVDNANYICASGDTGAAWSLLATLITPANWAVGSTPGDVTVPPGCTWDIAPVCPDDHAEGAEVCDGTDLDDQTCLAGTRCATGRTSTVPPASPRASTMAA
jgi:hypothetical protein